MVSSENLDKLKRDENGLLPFNYEFLPNSRVNWRKCIKPEHLVPNRTVTQETDITKLQDSEILVLLAGLKELAFLRGFESVYYEVVSASTDYVAVSCQIYWLPNYETQGERVTFSALADAHSNNTEGFGSNFLATVAENRAFARCVRGFLGINIRSREEMKSSPVVEAISDKSMDTGITLAILENLMREKKITLEKIKERLIKEGLAEASNYQLVRDIPPAKVFDLIEILKKIKPGDGQKKRGRPKKLTEEIQKPSNEQEIDEKTKNEEFNPVPG